MINLQNLLMCYQVVILFTFLEFILFVLIDLDFTIILILNQL